MKNKKNNIVIYTKIGCPFCVHAVHLLKSKKQEFIEYEASMDLEKREEMLAKSNGKRTYPQIFINNQHIGGCDDIYALEQKKELDKILGID